MAIDKDWTIGQTVSQHPETVPVFQNNGMSCLGCPATQFETLEQGAQVHGIDLDKLLSELNEAVVAPAE